MYCSNDGQKSLCRDFLENIGLLFTVCLSLDEKENASMSQPKTCSASTRHRTMPVESNMTIAV